MNFHRIIVAYLIDNTTWANHDAAITCCTWGGIGRSGFSDTFRRARFIGNTYRAATQELHKSIFIDEDGTLSGTGESGSVIGDSPVNIADDVCERGEKLGHGQVGVSRPAGGDDTLGRNVAFCKRRFEHQHWSHNTKTPKSSS